MPKYHVNMSTGKVGICQAKKICPVGGPHFTNEEDAQIAVEKLFEERKTASLSKHQYEIYPSQQQFETYNPNIINTIQDNNKKESEFPLYAQEMGLKKVHQSRRTRDDEKDFKNFIHNFSEDIDTVKKEALRNVAVSYFEARFSHTALTHLQRMVKEDLVGLTTDHKETENNYSVDNFSEKYLGEIITQKVRFIAEEDMKKSGLRSNSKTARQTYFGSPFVYQNLEEIKNAPFFKARKIKNNWYITYSRFPGSAGYYRTLKNEKEVSAEVEKLNTKVKQVVDKLEVSLSGYIRAKDLQEPRENLIEMSKDPNGFTEKFSGTREEAYLSYMKEKLYYWDKKHPAPEEKTSLKDSFIELFKPKNETYQSKIQQHQEDRRRFQNELEGNSIFFLR